MSEQQRQTVESAVRRFLKRVIRTGGTLPNGAHPIIDSEVYRLVNVEVTRHFEQHPAGKGTVKDICDRLIPLINSRKAGQRFDQRRASADTVAFTNQSGFGETVLA